MGCWNGTCMISNLPIISGEKIKLVLLQGGYDYKNASLLGNSGYVYSTGVFSPAFLPINGEYNDYGSIENVEEDWNYKLIESFLKGKFEILQADGVEIIDWKLTDLFDGIERGEPKYRSNTSTEWKDCNLSMVMIRQDVWDLCVSIQSNNEGYWNPDRTSGSGSNVPYQITGTVWANRTFDEFLERNKRVYADAIEEFRASLLRNSETVFGYGGSDSRPLLSNHEYKELCLVNKNDEEFNQSVKKSWIELQMIDGFVSNVRKGWMIQPGAGSQNCDWNIYSKFSQGIIKICEFKEEEYN